MLRKVVQGVLKNSRVQSFVESSALGEATADQFIAGIHVNDAVDAVIQLKDAGFLATVERLLESPADESHAQSNAIAYIDCIRALAAAGLGRDLDLTVQLSALGLALINGENIASDNLSKVCQVAYEMDMTVTVGMEKVEFVPATLRIIHSLSERFSNLGITLQSSLLRSEQDAAVFAASGARVRLCKGAFTQDPDHSHTAKADVDKAFVREMRTLLKSSAYVMIATHDSRLLQIGQALALRSGRTKDSFEFQMYLGVSESEQKRLLGLNHRVRIHVPFGQQWYPLVTQRLTQTPKSFGKAITSLLPGKS